MRIDLTCPIELYEYERPTEDNPYCTLVFFNLDYKLISSVQVLINLLDAEGNQLARVMERCVDLHGVGKELFEAAVPCDTKWVHAIDVTVEKVWFDDATVWRRNNSMPLAEYTPNYLAPSPQRDNLITVAGPDAVGFPDDQGVLWVCVCGRPNAAHETLCHRCGRDKQLIFDQFNANTVQQTVQHRERMAQDQLLRTQLEEARRIQEKKEAEAYIRRKHRNRVLAITSAVVVVVCTYLMTVYGIPEIRYRYAEAQLNAGSGEQARAAFAALGDYRDSKQRLRDSDFQMAMQLLGNSDAAVREQGFQMLDGMTDYPIAKLQAQKARYIEAGDAMKRGDYAAAEALLRKVGEYAEAKDMLSEAVYQIANQEQKEGSFESAGERFASLGAFRDAAVRAQECVYKQASRAYADQQYLQAASLYTSIPDYLDAKDRARESVYQQGVALEYVGKYEEAIVQLEKLGGYKDAIERAKNCVYVPAKKLMDSEQYEQAGKMFAEIPSYLDANDLAKACVYLPAKKLLNAGEQQKAVDLLATIPGYEDADTLRSQAIYRLAEDKLKGGAKADAAQMFESIAGHEDATARAQAIRYDLAGVELEAKRYDAAIAQFTELGGYQDAAGRVKVAQYAKAQQLLTEKKWEDARKAFLALDSYSDAAKLADQSLYSQAVEQRDAGKFEEAASLFSQLGKFQDAQSQVLACKYSLADSREKAGDLEQAGKLFEALGNYSNAKERSDRCYDLWLAKVQSDVYKAMDAEEYVKVISLLEQEGVPLAGLPKQYATLSDIYRQAHLSYARQLIGAGNPLAAYPYLKKISSNKDAERLLDQYVFKILGSWATSDGLKAEFRADGTCAIDGKELYFNVDGYALMIGETPKPLTRTHSIVSLDTKQLTIQRNDNNNVIKYARTGDAK